MDLNQINFEDLISLLKEDEIEKVSEIETTNNLNLLEITNKSEFEKINKIMALIFMEDDYIYKNSTRKNVSLILEENRKSLDKIKKFKFLCRFVLTIIMFLLIFSFTVLNSFVSIMIWSIFLLLYLFKYNLDNYYKDVKSILKKEKQKKIFELIDSISEENQNKEFNLIHLIYNSLKTNDKILNQNLKNVIREVLNESLSQSKIIDLLAEIHYWDIKSLENQLFVSLIDLKKDNGEIYHQISMIYKKINKKLKVNL